MGNRLCMTARILAWVVLAGSIGLLGCFRHKQVLVVTGNDDLPKELAKSTLPEYVIEPPDILVIDALRAIPRPPYRIATLDTLSIQLANALPNEPLAGLFVVDPDGSIGLGATYGSVRVVGMTIPEATAAIKKYLIGARILKDPQLSVSLAQSRASQQIRGQHLVRPDGTVGLGLYGSVRVTGLTLAEARVAIEGHLAQFLQDPEVSIDVQAFNSKVYYIVFDGAGNGQQVIRLPVTGNDTVLDAISQVYGLVPVADQNRIWVARPSPADSSCDQILPVDWKAIVTRGRTATNYQLLPGDRLFVHSDCLLTLDTRLSRLFAPIERVFGITLLGTSTVNSFRSNSNGNNNNSGGNGIIR